MENDQAIDYEYLLNPSHVGGLGDLVLSVYQKYFDENTVKDYDLIGMLQSASEKITTQKLLLVPHSQGNFYANSFYDVVADQPGGVPQQSIGIYGVATPAGRVAGGGNWITSDTDKVIAGIVADTPFKMIMKPNAHIDLQADDDFWGHDFSSVYLKYEGSRMVSDIRASLSKLSPNKVQDPQKPCINPPQITIGHMAEGTLLWALDPAAGMIKSGISATGDGVYAAGAMVSGASARIVGAFAAAGNFVAQKTIDIAMQVYAAGASAVHAAISSLVTDQPKAPLAAQALETMTSDIQAAREVPMDTRPIALADASANADSVVSGPDLIDSQNFASDTQDESIAEAKAAVPTTTVEEAVQVPAVQQKVCTFGATASPTHKQLIINEVAWMGGSVSANDEWVELHNISGGPLDVSGWQLLDKDEQIKVAFGNRTIENGAYVLLERTDDTSVPGVAADAIYAGVLSNADEGLRLFDSQCNLIDEAAADPNWPAGDAAARRTMERSLDLSWHTYAGSGINPGGTMIYGTPKQENSQPGVVATGSVSVPVSPSPSTPPSNVSTQKILIAEVQITGGTGKSNNDFVELYNPNAYPVNLIGFRLVKRTKTGTSDSSIKSWAADAIIPAQGYYLWANAEYSDIGAVPDATTTATLANDNGIALRNGPENTGTVIDSVAWGAADNGFAESRAFPQNPGANESIARLSPNDTDVNANDFIRSISSPRNAAMGGGFIAPNPIAAASSSATNHVVISEIYPDQTGANQDFVELYDPGLVGEDLAGWSLQVLSGTATSTGKIEKKNFVSGSAIPASGFFLVGIDRYSSGDMTWASGSLNSSSGATIFLVHGTTTITSFDDPAIIDRVAYGSGQGLAPEGAVALMPAVGASLERKAVQGIDCAAASSANEFAGNGCDTDNNEADFDQRTIPTPQGFANLSEPRNAPGTLAHFSISYSTTTMQVALTWDTAADASGATSTITYNLASATSTNPLTAFSAVTATSSVSTVLHEVGVPFHFSITARDRDGLASAPATADITPDPIFSGVYAYPDPRTPGATALELRYPSYPFLPNLYGGNGWHLVVAYLNQDAPAIPYLSSDTQYEGLPDGVSPKEYGEWGTGNARALAFQYPNCSGYWSSDITALVLADAESQCSSAYGGVRNKSMRWNQLEDPSMIVALSQNQIQPGPGDYLTLATYAYAGNNMQQLVAVDHQKYYFQTDVPVHQAPTVPANIETSFDPATGLLRLIWDASTDPDSYDPGLRYEISYGTTTPADGNWVQAPYANLLPDEFAVVNNRPFTKIPLEAGMKYAIGLRAKDDFGNVSDPLMFSFTAPDAAVAGVF